MKRQIIFILLALLVLPLRALADEGMWLLPLLKKNNEAAMKNLGLAIPAEEIAGSADGSLYRAVVSFGGFCTASFISPEGLLLTNYHCSYNAVQQHSSMTRNIVEHGFWASQRAEELPISGLSITLNKSIIDVSDEVNKATATLGGGGQNLRKATEQVSQRHSVPGLKNIIKSYKNGTIHILYHQQVFEDVRIVGVPPKQVAKFGGETDNWMWPRHSADFAYFRVYTSPDGSPAKYSANNIPMHPDQYLNVSVDGYDRGNFAMSIGFPGYTDRQATSARVWEVRNVHNAPMTDIRSVRMNIMKERMDADPRIALMYAEKYSTAANEFKNAQGMNEWIDRLGVVAGKRAFEEKLVRWINADPDRRARYPDVENYLKTQTKAHPEYYMVLGYFHEAFIENSDMLRFAASFGGWMYSAKYNPGGGAGKLSDFVSTARSHYKAYDRELDAAITKATIRLIREKVPAELLPSFYEVIDRDYGGDPDRYVDMLYEESIFSDIDRIVAWTEKPYRDYNSDQVVVLLKSVDEKRREISNMAGPGTESGYAAGAGQYGQALIEYKGEGYYPNADGTMRLSYGTVQDLSYAGTAANYQTYLSELIAKEDGVNSDYNVPAQLKQIWQSKDFTGYSPGPDMPVCFITDGDVTGGNSGSPMLDARGRLIGLVFDCNWESMTRDYNYDRDMNRVICLDIRYMMLITEKFSGSRTLSDEILPRN